MMRPLCILLATACACAAHQLSDAWLIVSQKEGQVSLRWDAALRDLQVAVDLDGNQDGDITWGEVLQARPRLEAYAAERLRLSSDGQAKPLSSRSLAIVEHGDVTCAAMEFSAETKASSAMQLAYSAFFDFDARHRGLAKLQKNGSEETRVLSPEEPVLVWGEGQLSSTGSRFLGFLREGVWHIWLGYDHVLFLLVLLLPAVLRRQPGSQWIGIERIRPAVLRVLKIVTAFTIAHSLTLAPAALGLVRLPARFVESAIALSILLPALWNLLGRGEGFGQWQWAFGFGLLHGFGFANVLAELDLGSGSLATPLFGFNLGVELGQLAIVLVFLPFAALLRHTSFYRSCVFRFGSLATAILASCWLADRACALRFMPF